MRKLNQDYIVAGLYPKLPWRSRWARSSCLWRNWSWGLWKTKGTKNLFSVCEHAPEQHASHYTVGVISEDDVTGLTLIAEPNGVVCGITPQPGLLTAIFKALISLKTREPLSVLFSPPIFAKNHLLMARIVRDAAIAAEHSENCAMDYPTFYVEANQCSYEPWRSCDHPATGGNAMVSRLFFGETSLGWCLETHLLYVENQPISAKQHTTYRHAPNHLTTGWSGLNSGHR